MQTVDLTIDFLSALFIDDTLTYNSYVFTLKLYPNTINYKNLNIAYNRIYYFFEIIVESSIFANEVDIDAIQRLVDAGLPVLTILDPGPADQILQRILTAKCHAIIENTFEIIETRLSSKLGDGMVYTFRMDKEKKEDNDNDDDDDYLNPYKWWNIPKPMFINQYLDENNEPLFDSPTWDELQLGWNNEDEYQEQPSLPEKDTHTTNNVIQLHSKKHNELDDN